MLSRSTPPLSVKGVAAITKTPSLREWMGEAMGSGFPGNTLRMRSACMQLHDACGSAYRRSAQRPAGVSQILCVTRFLVLALAEWCPQSFACARLSEEPQFSQCIHAQSPGFCRCHAWPVRRRILLTQRDATGGGLRAEPVQPLLRPPHRGSLLIRHDEVHADLALRSRSRPIDASAREPRALRGAPDSDGKSVGIARLHGSSERVIHSEPRRAIDNRVGVGQCPQIT